MLFNYPVFVGTLSLTSELTTHTLSICYISASLAQQPL